MRTRKNKKIIGGGNTIKSIQKLVKYLESIGYFNKKYETHDDSETKKLYNKLSEIITDNNDLLRSAKNINSLYGVGLSFNKSKEHRQLFFELCNYLYKILQLINLKILYLTFSRKKNTDDNTEYYKMIRMGKTENAYDVRANFDKVKELIQALPRSIKNYSRTIGQDSNTEKLTPLIKNIDDLIDEFSALDVIEAIYVAPLRRQGEKNLNESILKQLAIETKKRVEAEEEAKRIKRETERETEREAAERDALEAEREAEREAAERDALETEAADAEAAVIEAEKIKENAIIEVNKASDELIDADKNVKNVESLLTTTNEEKEKEQENRKLKKMEAEDNLKLKKEELLAATANEKAARQRYEQVTNKFLSNDVIKREGGRKRKRTKRKRTTKKRRRTRK